LDLLWTLSCLCVAGGRQQGNCCPLVIYSLYGLVYKVKKCSLIVIAYFCFRDSHPKAYRLGQIASKGDNIEKFLMGRQANVSSSPAKLYLTSLYIFQDGKYIFYF
jgi:hypothetical protein